MSIFDYIHHKDLDNLKRSINHFSFYQQRNGYNPIQYCCINKYYEGLEFLLSTDYDINAIGTTIETAPYLCCKEKWIEGLELVLSKKMNIIIKNVNKIDQLTKFYKLVYSYKGGHNRRLHWEEGVNILLKYGYYPDNIANFLLELLSNSDYKQAKLIISNIKEIYHLLCNCKQISFICSTKKIETLDFLIMNKLIKLKEDSLLTMKILISLSTYKWIQGLHFLIKKGLNINMKYNSDSTILYTYCKSGWIEGVLLLISNDVDIKDIYCNQSFFDIIWKLNRYICLDLL